MRPAVIVLAAMLAGCGQIPSPGVSQGAIPQPRAAGVVPNLAYQFLGPQMLVFRFDADARRVRELVEPRFEPEVRDGRSPVYALVAEYHTAAAIGLPAYGVKAREIVYTALCGATGRDGDRKGFATFAIVEESPLLSWLMRDVGYPASSAPLRWSRSGDRMESTGEADLALTRKTDPLSRALGTASLTRLLIGKNDHLAHSGEVVEVPLAYPAPLLDGYGVKVDRASFGTLARLGLVAPGQAPAEAWWWEGPNVILGRRQRYPLPGRTQASGENRR